MNRNSTLIILCGIPCSGKSTWTKKFLKANTDAIVVSRDIIREVLMGKHYKFTSSNEKKVTSKFYEELDTACRMRYTYIIIDNTHTKEGGIESYFKILDEEENIKIYVKFFDIPLWKAYLRNIWRNLCTGKFIPFNVIYSMYKAYNKINKDRYKCYIFTEHEQKILNRRSPFWARQYSRLHNF